MPVEVHVNAAIVSPRRPVLHHAPADALDVDACTERDGARRCDGAPLHRARARRCDSLRALPAADGAGTVCRDGFAVRGGRGEQQQQQDGVWFHFDLGLVVGGVLGGAGGV